jgi:ribosomal protein L21
MGNRSGKLGRNATMENVTTSTGKPLSKERIIVVETITNLKHEVCKLIKLRAKQLEEKKKGLQNHLISLKFSMGD